MQQVVTSILKQADQQRAVADSSEQRGKSVREALMNHRQLLDQTLTQGQQEAFNMKASAMNTALGMISQATKTPPIIPLNGLTANPPPAAASPRTRCAANAASYG